MSLLARLGIQTAEQTLEIQLNFSDPNTKSQKITANIL